MLQFLTSVLGEWTSQDIFLQPRSPICCRGKRAHFHCYFQGCTQSHYDCTQSHYGIVSEPTCTVGTGFCLWCSSDTWRIVAVGLLATECFTGPGP